MTSASPSDLPPFVRVPTVSLVAAFFLKSPLSPTNRPWLSHHLTSKTRDFVHVKKKLRHY